MSTVANPPPDYQPVLKCNDRRIALEYAIQIHEYLVDGAKEAPENADALVQVAKKFEAYLSGQDRPTSAAKPDFSGYDPPGIYCQGAGSGVPVDFSREYLPGIYDEIGHHSADEPPDKDGAF